MVAAVETMAYAGETPWHGLGNKVSNNLTPAQMLKAAKLDWPVEKRELMYATKKGGGTPIKVDGKFALVRGTDDRLLSIIGATYKPVQNEVVMDFFKKFVLAGHMKMETAGALHGGQYIWALARLGNDFTLGKEDEVRGFLLLSQPHVLGKAMVIQFTPIRVVCWNTLTFALGSDLKGKPGSFRMPHSIAFNDAVKKRAEEALGLSKHQMDEFKQAATLLSKKKAKPEDVESYFCEVLKFDPKTAAKKAKGKKGEEAEIKVPRMLPKLQLALTHAPGAQMPTALGTWWGAANAVTYVVDHELGRDQSASLRTAWLGAKAALKRRAVGLAIKRAS